MRARTKYLKEMIAAGRIPPARCLAMVESAYADGDITLDEFRRLIDTPSPTYERALACADAKVNAPGGAS